MSLKIKELREVKGLTQDEVVAKTGISKRSYVSYENGKADIPFSKLQEIANALSVSIVDLINDEIQSESKSIGGIIDERFEVYEKQLTKLKKKLKKTDKQLEQLVEALTLYMKAENEEMESEILEDILSPKPISHEFTEEKLDS